MTLFEQIVSEILLEDVGIGKINDAIRRSYEVKINYLSDDDKASGERIIQPVAYGLTKAGKPVIRAYQPFGDTQTKVPAWKMFLVSGIQSWKPLYKRTFNKPPEGFNPNGDKSMSVVYKVAKFFNNPSQEIAKQPEPVKAKGPVKKIDIQKPEHIGVKDNENIKKLEKLKKQLDNPTYISDIIKNKEFGTDKNQTSQDNSQMTANSGPVTKDSFKTQTETDIQNKYNQLNKNEKVSQDVLNQWKKEQEKRNNKRNGSNRTGIE